MAIDWLAVAYIVILLASSYYSYTEIEKAKKMFGKDRGRKGTLVNTRSSDAVLSVVYGRCRVGGNQVFVSTYGNANERLYIIQTLSEGPIDSIEQVYLNGIAIQSFGLAHGWSGQYAGYEAFLGTDSQSYSANLYTKYGMTDTMRYTAYIIMSLLFEKSIFAGGLPKITVTIRGRKLYDPRTTLTAYSNNPALVVYDFMTNKRYGLGLPTSDMDAQSFIDAANWFENQTVPYTFNGVINTRQSFLDNLLSILVNCRSDILWSGGKYKLLVRKYDTPVMSLTEDDIIAESFTFVVPGLAETPNRIIVKYPDAAGTDPNDLGWVEKTQIIEDSNSILLFDGEERDMELSLIGTSNASQANLLGIYELERARINKTYSFTAHPRCLALDPGDMIKITHALPGWADRVVRVIEIGLSQGGVVGMTVIDEDAQLYDDTLNLSPHTYFNTNFPNAEAVPGQVTGVTFTEEEYVNKDETKIRLRVALTPPSPSNFWKEAKVWVSTDLGVTYTYFNAAEDDFTLDPADEKATYYFKFISISVYGVQGTPVYYVYTMQGSLLVPDDISSFTVAPTGDGIRFVWSKIIETDLMGYELRYGPNWLASILVQFAAGVNFSVLSVKPGTHTFQIKAKDTMRQYSTNALSGSVTVFWPPFYTQKAVNPASGGDQFNTGTHNNTEYIDHGTYGRVLRLLSNSIPGEYYSPTYDLGSVIKARHWSEFLWEIEGNTATWETMFSPSYTWADKAQTGTTWLALFSASQAGDSLEMYFEYSTNNVNWARLTDFTLVAHEVEARYIRYGVILTDTNPSYNMLVRPVTLRAAFWV